MKKYLGGTFMNVSIKKSKRKTEMKESKLLYARFAVWLAIASRSRVEIDGSQVSDWRLKPKPKKNQIKIILQLLFKNFWN